MKFRKERKKPVGLAVLLVVLLLLPVIVSKTYYLHVFIITLLNIIVVSSLRTVSLSGQISVAHAAFMGLGGYFSAVIAKEFGISPWLTIPLGGVFAGLVAVIVGIPFSRVRAIYFSMVSLLGGIAIVKLIRVAQVWTGAAGLVGIPPLNPIRLPGGHTFIFIGNKVPFYYLALAVTIICLIIMYRIENCRIGMNWKAVAQSHLVASSIGINEAAYRVLALAIGCFFAGISGGLYAHYNLVLTNTTFGFLPSIFLVMYMLVGGVKKFSGPIIGTAVLVMIPELFRGLKEFTPLIIGAIMLFVVYLMPQGLAGLIEQIAEKFEKEPEPGREEVNRAT